MTTTVKDYQDNITNFRNFRISCEDVAQAEASSIVTSSRHSANVFREAFARDNQDIRLIECMYALFLSRSNKTIGITRLSVGGVSQCIVDSKVLFASALLSGASAIILCHNHPSGATSPSRADREVTKKIIEGAKLLDMQLLDHIILTENDYHSFVDNGDM